MSPMEEVLAGAARAAKGDVSRARMNNDLAPVRPDKRL